MPDFKPSDEDKKYEEFVRELAHVINKYSVENRSDTPDFMLADFMAGCLNVYENTIRNREDHKSR